MKHRKHHTHVLPKKGFGGGVKLGKPIVVDDHSFLQVIEGENTGTIGAVVGKITTALNPVKSKKP